MSILTRLRSLRPLRPLHDPGLPEIARSVAIIMDGNGRWAKQRLLPRVAGHRKGVEAVRATVRACIERGVEFLTLFAFSSENWRRPADEVSILMQLFVRALEQEVTKLNDNGIRFKVIGDTSRFEPKIRELIAGGETLTAMNSRLMLTIAANYGGRWDIAQAAGKLLAAHPDAARGFTPEALVPGTLLRRFDGAVFRIRTIEKEKREIERLVVVIEGADQDALTHGVDHGKVVGESVNFARDLANEPGAYMTPTNMADRARTPRLSTRSPA